MVEHTTEPYVLDFIAPPTLANFMLGEGKCRAVRGPIHWLWKEYRDGSRDVPPLHHAETG